MINVDQVQRWRSGWAAAGGRIAAAQRAPAVGGAALSVLAVTELIARFGLDPRSLGRLAQTTSNTAANTQGVVVICLLCLSITLPLAFLRSGVAAVAFCAACVIALALFQGESSTSAVRVAGSGVSTHVTPAASTGLSTQSAVVLCLLCLATTLPLAFLRRAAAAVTICAACVIALALFQMLTVAGLCAQLIAGYRLGRGDPRHGDSRHSDSRHGDPQQRGAQLWAVALTLPFLILALAGPGGSENHVLAVLLASLAPAAALAGIARRARSEAVEHSTARQVIAGSLSEHVARGERARISRELHDVVAHHISMIAVQAETARVTTQGLPAPAAQRLLAIGDTARTALTEMRRLLGVLREDVEDAPAQNGPGLLERGLPSPGLLGPGQQSPGGRRASRQPQPGLGQLNELIDETRAAAGTGARLIVRGPVAPLDPGVELAAYRIVQEALTNARRHAPGAAVDVELNYTGTELQLLIRDNGPGPPQAADGGRPMAHSAELEGGGHGLPGMRERALAVGGKLSAGAAAGGGFLVEARLSAKTEDA